MAELPRLDSSPSWKEQAMHVQPVFNVRNAVALALAGLLGSVAFAAPSSSQPSWSLLIPKLIAQVAPTAAPTLMQPTPAQPTQVQPSPLQPSQQPVIDEGVDAPNSLPAPSSATVRRPPRIVYDTDRDARRMYGSGSVNLIMVTQNPADHCLYEIPLCIPACVTGEPRVSSYCGLFGRGVVEYCWPNGFEAKVKFRNIGDVRVDYEGD
jgi:hypothetical protein